jgi:hypothetical protein
MADTLNIAALRRWRADPIQFIEQVLRDPESGEPFELFDAEREFFAHAWRTDASGRLLYPEQCFGAPKKSGKTQIAAIHLLTTTILFGGKFPESFALANDLEQATGRVFQAVCRVCEASPLLARDCKITQSKIEFPNIRAVIQACFGRAGVVASHRSMMPRLSHSRMLSMVAWLDTSVVAVRLCSAGKGLRRCARCTLLVIRTRMLSLLK